MPDVFKFDQRVQVQISVSRYVFGALYDVYETFILYQKSSRTDDNLLNGMKDDI